MLTSTICVIKTIYCDIESKIEARFECALSPPSLSLIILYCYPPDIGLNKYAVLMIVVFKKTLNSSKNFDSTFYITCNQTLHLQGITHAQRHSGASALDKTRRYNKVIVFYLPNAL